MTSLRRGGRSELLDRMPELLAVYRSAFLELHEPDPEGATAARATIMHRHADRGDLIVVTADDDDGLVGFCYGYRGSPGQWWHDVVAAALGPTAGPAWLGDCREIAELHVRPDAQGRGYGRLLLQAGLAGATERTVALSVLDEDRSAARRLYESEGFETLLGNFRFPGTPTPYAILGKRLPAAG